MNPQHHMRFAARPLSAAILMALATPAAFAAVPNITPSQVPGQGAITYNTYPSAPITVTAAASPTAPITQQWNLSATTAQSAGAAVVIQWGGNTNPTLNASGTAGFNIGAQAGVEFRGTSKVSYASVLNIDASGNPSVILGQLSAAGNVGALFVANANGIVVGSSAVITTPGGLGLVNANLTGISSGAFAALQTSGKLPLDFQGVTGGVTIEPGADLSSIGTDGFLLVAGAGNVNIGGAFVSSGGVTTYSIPKDTSVVVDGGVGGVFSAVSSSTGVVATVTPQDSGPAQPLSALSAGNLSTFSYQDAPGTTVALNLGITTSPYSAAKLSVLADGNINLASGGDLTNVTTSTFNWSGLLTNNGVMDYGHQLGSTLTPTTATADIYAAGAGLIYANTTTAQYGGFDNATSGLVNAGSIYASGSSFSNAGTLQMGQSSSTVMPVLSASATTGNIHLGGTVDVVDVGNYTGPTALSSLYLSAASTTGQSVTVNTATPLLVSGGGSAMIEATNVNLDSSLTVSGGNFHFYPYSVNITSAAPVSGSFVLASGATLSAANLSLGDGAAYHGPAYTSYKINGSMVATGTASAPGGSVILGGSPSGFGKASVFNVSGAGSITAGTLTFNNLLGSVNNITTGQILANGFKVNAPTGGAVNISVDAVGSAPQGFNLNVNGNATLNSGGTQAVLTQKPAGNTTYKQYLMPANANSNLVVQTSGNLTVNGVRSLNNYGLTSISTLFQWPGLVYLQANGGQLTSTTAIANAYAAQASTGHAGVFLIGDNITDNHPIYTNGNAGVVFAAPYSASLGIYPYASTINGIDPTKASPSLPTVYFATPNPTVANANFSFQVLNSFTNEHGYQQENQTFLTLP